MEEMKEKVHAVEIPVEWYIPEGIRTQYATNMVVQHTENEFVLSFFEAFPPLSLVGPLTPEEHTAKLAEIKSIRGTCIARIVVSPDLMERIIKVLQTNLERFKQIKQE